MCILVDMPLIYAHTSPNLGLYIQYFLQSALGTDCFFEAVGV